MQQRLADSYQDFEIFCCLSLDLFVFLRCCPAAKSIWKLWPKLMENRIHGSISFHPGHEAAKQLQTLTLPSQFDLTRSNSRCFSKVLLLNYHSINYYSNCNSHFARNMRQNFPLFLVAAALPWWYFSTVSLIGNHEHRPQVRRMRLSGPYLYSFQSFCELLDEPGTPEKYQHSSQLSSFEISGSHCGSLESRTSKMSCPNYSLNVLSWVRIWHINSCKLIDFKPFVPFLFFSLFSL